MNSRINKQVLIAIPVLLMGGTEIQTLSLVRVLVAAGYRAIVCCYYEFDDSVVAQFKEAGAEVILLRLDRSDGRFGFFRILELIRKLITMFRAYRPDIVHVQYVAPGLVPILTAKLSGVPTIFATVHQPGTPYGLKAKLLLCFGAYLCTAFFCVSKSSEESWFGDSEIFDPQHVNRRRKHFTIYNTVDASRFARAVNLTDHDKLKKSMGLDGCPVVGVVGRLRKEKGHLVLLDAMTEVVKYVPDAKLLVVGDGPDRNKLKRKSEDLDIIDHVLWIGAKEPEEVYQLYGIMDVVAVPSLFEGFGLTAAEAMAAGRPVVASAVDGLNEVVKNRHTGFLFPVNDSGAMAKCLIELLSDPSKVQAMGEAGRQRVIQYFSQERFAEATLSAYRHFFSN